MLHILIFITFQAVDPVFCTVTALFAGAGGTCPLAFFALTKEDHFYRIKL